MYLLAHSVFTEMISGKVSTLVLQYFTVLDHNERLQLHKGALAVMYSA